MQHRLNPRPEPPYLEIVRSAKKQKFYLNAYSTIVGCEPDCDIELTDPAIAGHNLEILQRNFDRYFVRPIDLSYPILKNGRLVQRTVRLKSGDLLGLGSLTLAFRDTTPAFLRRRGTVDFVAYVLVAICLIWLLLNFFITRSLPKPY